MCNLESFATNKLNHVIREDGQYVCAVVYNDQLKEFNIDTEYPVAQGFVFNADELQWLSTLITNLNDEYHENKV